MRLCTSSSSMCWPARASRVRGVIAASWRYGSTATTPSSPSAPARGGDGAVLADQQDGGADHLGPVLQPVITLVGHRCRREVAEAERSVGADQQVIGVDLAVGDPGDVEVVQVCPQLGKGVVTDIVLDGGGQRCAVRAHHHERITASGAARRDQGGDAHAGSLGEEGHEPLVLDELDPAQPGRALGVAVPGESPEVGQQLAVPGVAAVDLDRQRPVLVGAREQHDALGVHGGRGEVLDGHAEALQGEADARCGRAAARRPDGHVHDGGGEEPHGDGGHATGGERDAEEHRCHHLTGDEPSPEVAEGSAEVGRGGGDGGRGDGQRPGREHGCRVDVGEPAQDVPGPAGDDGADDRRDGDGDGAGGEEVTGQRRASAHDGNDGQGQRPDHGDPEQQVPDRGEEVGELGEDIGEPEVEVGTQGRQRGGDDEQQQAGDGQRDVSGSSRPRLVLGRARTAAAPAAGGSGRRPHASGSPRTDRKS